MESRINVQGGIEQSLKTQDFLTETHPAKQGSHDGRTVTVSAGSSSLIDDDAAAPAVETEEKKLEERKRTSPDQANTMAMQQAEYLIEKAVDWTLRRRVFDFADHLKKNAGLTAPQLRLEARLFFPDVSDQYVGLFYAKAQIDQQPGFNLLKKGLAEALESLEQEHGPAIRAGLNTADAARESSAGDTAAALGLRDLYRDTVLDYKGVLAAFDSILEKYGEKDFLKAVHFLIKAVGRDMASTGPSSSPVQLKQINDDLFQLEALNHLHGACERVLNRMRTVYEAPHTSDNTRQLMHSLLQMKDERWISPSSVSDLAKSLHISGASEQVHFLRELKELTRLLPLKLYAIPENRDTFLQAVQGALDEAIEREEA